MKFMAKLYISLVIICFSGAVKVNLRGSLHLGQEIMDSIIEYMKHKQLQTRRSMALPVESEEIQEIVKSVAACKETDLCPGSLEDFLNNYIILLARTLQSILLGVLEPTFHSDKNRKETNDSFIFEKELRGCLREVKNIMMSIQDNRIGNQDIYIWLTILKRIRILFENTALDFAKTQLESNVEEMNKFRKKLSQKIMAAMVVAEAKYENRLCGEQNICYKSFECTDALNKILILITKISEAKSREFVRYVYEALATSKFYSYLNEVTAYHFQIILSDMSFTENVSSKDVISTLQKVVQSRIDSITNNNYISKGLDARLIYIILSDMDHLYSKRGASSLYNFLREFKIWSTEEKGSLKTQVRHVMSNIADALKSQPKEMFDKVVNEVKLFLEITVDPET